MPQEVGPRLILASTSRYRRELLQRLQVPFDVASPAFDESTLEHRFEALDDAAFALELARAKAMSLRPDHGDDWVLAADQIAVVREGDRRTLLHKPETVEGAVAQLMSLSGRTHVLTTGVVLVRPALGEVREAIDRQVMTMRPFEEAEARRYAEAFAPVDCVGAYRIEDAGITLFASIEGADYTGIIGLPLLAVARLLREVGLMC